MQREILKNLIKWKDIKNRKPLIIHGARQGRKIVSKDINIF